MKIDEITISRPAFLYLEALTKTGLYGQTAHETATILLLEKLREIKEKETK